MLCSLAIFAFIKCGNIQILFIAPGVKFENFSIVPFYYCDDDDDDDGGGGGGHLVPMF